MFKETGYIKCCTCNKTIKQNENCNSISITPCKVGHNDFYKNENPIYKKYFCKICIDAMTKVYMNKIIEIRKNNGIQNRIKLVQRGA